MKLFLSFFLFSSLSFAKNSNCDGFMPKNKLWQQDTVFLVSNEAEKKFNEIISVGKKVYAPITKSEKETLTINPLWSDPTVNANATRYGKQAVINMYGGLFRRKEITPDGFALVLCHELNHLYGWDPYIYPESWISAEGQADYAGAFYCLQNILKETKDTAPKPTAYILSICKKDRLCQRQMLAAMSTSAMLNIGSGEVLDFSKPDATVVRKTITTYPRTVQCRMDTYLNGIFQLPRPSCWFK